MKNIKMEIKLDKLSVEVMKILKRIDEERKVDWENDELPKIIASEGDYIKFNDLLVMLKNLGTFLVQNDNKIETELIQPETRLEQSLLEGNENPNSTYSVRYASPFDYIEKRKVVVEKVVVEEPTLYVEKVY